MGPDCVRGSKPFRNSPRKERDFASAHARDALCHTSRASEVAACLVEGVFVLGRRVLADALDGNQYGPVGFRKTPETTAQWLHYIRAAFPLAVLLVAP